MLLLAVSEIWPPAEKKAIAFFLLSENGSENEALKTLFQILQSHVSSTKMSYRNSRSTYRTKIVLYSI